MFVWHYDLKKYKWKWTCTAIYISGKENNRPRFSKFVDKFESVPQNSESGLQSWKVQIMDSWPLQFAAKMCPNHKGADAGRQCLLLCCSQGPKLLIKLHRNSLAKVLLKHNIQSLWNMPVIIQFNISDITLPHTNISMHNIF